MDRRNPSCISGFSEDSFTFNIGTLEGVGDKKPQIKKLYEILRLMPGIYPISSQDV